MMQAVTRTLAISGLALLCPLFLGCSGNSPGPDLPGDPSRSFVAFRQPSMVIDRLETPSRPPYAIGSRPVDALPRSSDPGIVEVDPDGNLIAHRNGEVLVRGGGEAILRVVVQAAKVLEVVPHHLELVLGEKRDVQVLADGAALSPQAFRWQTSDPNIAAAFGSTVQA